jgi:hypothetical protein
LSTTPRDRMISMELALRLPGGAAEGVMLMVFNFQDVVCPEKTRAAGKVNHISVGALDQRKRAVNRRA